MSAARLTPTLLIALLACPPLALAQPEAAPDAEWPGRYLLRGQDAAGHVTRAVLTVEEGPAGGLRFRRVSDRGERRWTAAAPAASRARREASVRYGGEGSGLVRVLGRLGVPATSSPAATARYRLSESGALEEVLTLRSGEARRSLGRRTITLEQVTRFLDAQASARPLTRLGAQWRVLRLAHWRLGDSAEGHLRRTAAENPYDPERRHTLSIPLEDYPTVGALADRLEQALFPALLRWRPTRWSYEGAAYHAVAAVHLDGVSFTDPAQESAALASRWGDRLAVDLDHAAALRERYRAMQGNACPTVCLADMEEVVARGTLLALSHADLVEAVQDPLPDVLGCVGDNFTGGLKHNYDMRGYVRFGRWAFLGRPLYYRAMDKRRLDAPHYQGENLVLTEISDAAVADFGRMGGFGTVSNLPNFPQAGDTIDDEIRKLSGVSKVIAIYWKLRRGGHDEAAEALIDRPFFTETETSVRGSLGDWVRKLYGVNPRTPYKLFAYDYGYATWHFKRVVRAAEGLPGWRGPAE